MLLRYFYKTFGIREVCTNGAYRIESTFIKAAIPGCAQCSPEEKIFLDLDRLELLDKILADAVACDDRMEFI